MLKRIQEVAKVTRLTPLTHANDVEGPFPPNIFYRLVESLQSMNVIFSQSPIRMS